MAIQLQNNGWLPIPWAEYIGRSGSEGSDSAWSYDGGIQSTLTILINWTDAIAGIEAILGYAQRNPTTGNLDRVLPVRHPLYNQLYASRITSMRGRKWLGKYQSDIGWTSAYQYMMCSILFVQPKFTVLSDGTLDRLYGSPRQEFRRYTEMRFEPTTEFLSREGSKYVFAEGGPGGPNAGSSIVKGTVNQQLMKAELTLTWRRVPSLGFLSTAGVGPPTKALTCLGSVNSDTFLGYPPGVLLLKGVRFTPLEAPSDRGVNLLAGQPPTHLDIEMHAAVWDPPAGTAADVTPGPTFNQGATTRGHNLVPFPGTGAAAGRWWRVSQDATNIVGPNLFPSVSYAANLFTLSA